ncbi:methyltransferase family protein [Asticcacaulis solisilvae]|uniref:methyltransferase family protein n=1 Tax=Asticcacaulis solisilvae TaxID=1217274 RepID=UPI003FD88678
MNLIYRLTGAVTAGGVNALVLLAPVVLLRHAPFGDIGLLTAIAGLSLAVAVETFCGLPVPVSVSARSAGDLDWLNWLQGLALLASFEACCGWRACHPVQASVWLAAGAILLMTGVALRAAAILRLGAGFTNSAVPGNDTLCTGGVYAWLRHPAETGLCLIVTGFTGALEAWPIAATTLPAFAVLSVLRMRLEDRGLARAFPDAFQAYCRRVRL